MKKNDAQLGKPDALYKDTKANIEANFTTEGMSAFATDTHEQGFRGHAGWTWIPTGTTSGGHTIKDDGVGQTQRTNLNFVGNSFSLWDDAGNNATIVSGTAIAGPTGPVGPAGPPGNITLIYDDSVFKVTGTAIDFGANLSVAVTGSVAFVAGNAGGGSTQSDLFANRPAPSGDGTLFLPADGYTIDRATGTTAWISWGPIFPLTAPPTTGWSWDHSGTVAIEKDGIYIESPIDAAAALYVLYRTAPAPPYVITTIYLAEMAIANYQAVGICFRQSSDGKIHAFYHGVETNMIMRSNKWETSTSFNAHYNSAGPYAFQRLWFMRIADDNANRICSMSHDGQHWTQIHSIGRTDYLTADQVGLILKPQNANVAVKMTLLSWKET